MIMPVESKRSVVLRGIAASPGIHIGRVVAYNPMFSALGPSRVPAYRIPAQIRLLEEGLAKARDEIRQLQEKLRKSLDDAHAAIFDSHLLFVEDPALKEKTVARIRSNQESAAYALMSVIRELAEQFGRMQDAYISSRATDVFDIGRRISRHLLADEQNAPTQRFSGEVIIFAHDLSPSDTAQLDHARVKAFATEIGGPTSHTAILAKGLEIPAVVGVGTLLPHVTANTTAIVDGYEGTVTLNPAPAELKKARNRHRRRMIEERNLEKLKTLPAETLDGYRVELSANLELPDEIPHILAHGADGIGLFRTEFLYLNRERLPGEEEQFDIYRRTLESLAPGSVIFRTLDVGGDKLITNGSVEREMNPFLGLRAIRYCLKHRDLFKTQLRALLRASAFGRAKIMFPLVTSVSEIIEAKAALEEAKKGLASQGLRFDEAMEVGMIAEIPSAALIADQFADEVDFFSIGTNDLIQYTLAVDRANEKVAPLYDPYHPAILRLIRRVIDAAHRAGIWVGVCGEMSAHPPTALLLLGMGVDQFSMGSHAIPEIKHLFRSARLADARRLASEVYALGSSAEIRSRVEGAHRNLMKTGKKDGVGITPNDKTSHYASD